MKSLNSLGVSEMDTREQRVLSGGASYVDPTLQKDLDGDVLLPKDRSRVPIIDFDDPTGPLSPLLW